MSKDKNFFLEFKKIMFIFLFVFFVLYLLFDFISSFINYKNEVNTLRDKYLESKKEEVKKEVLFAVGYIDSEFKSQHTTIVQNAKTRVYEFRSIIDDIYKSNKTYFNQKKSLLKIFIEKLYVSNGLGGYFLIRKNQKKFYVKNEDFYIDDEKLFINKAIEGLSNSSEEVYDFSIQTNLGKNITAIVSYYKPLDLIMGVIIDESKYFDFIKRKILNRLANIRFGKEGYIFINSFDGIALISNGYLFYGQNKKLWEVLLNYPVKDVKSIFYKELEAAKIKGGDFIFYEWIKLSNLNKRAPKVSFIYGIDKFKWIVGAGVYLDDIENEVAILLNKLKKRYIIKSSMVGLFTILLLFIMVVVLDKMNIRLKNDFDIFVSFFNTAAFSNKNINADLLQYIEFKELSKYANKMLEDKRAYQKELINEQEKLKVTLKSIGDAVITTNVKGEIDFMNSEAETLFDIKCDDVKGRKFDEFFKLVNEKSGFPVECPVQKVINTKEKVYIDVNTVLHLINGRKYNIIDSAAPILDANNELIGVVIVFRDITKQLEMEKEVARNEKLEAIGILAGGIAHDFNNVLTGVFGNIELAKFTTDKNSNAYNFLNIALNALEQAKHLARQLLMFSKGDEPVLETVDLNSIIVDIVRFNLSGSNIRSNIHIKDNIYDIKVDRGQFSHLLSNLIINAKQAMKESGNLYIRAYNVDDISVINSDLKGKYVCIEVEDQGCGIKSDMLNKIFDPYFTTRDTGNGLGLAIVYSIIKRHNGYINVKSKVGQGTTFFIYLPADIKKDEQRNKYNSDDKILNIEGSVLVMDDMDMVGNVAKEILTSLGLNVDIVTNGHDAIEKYRKSLEEGNPYSFIILDLTIPGELGGEYVAKEVLKLNAKAKIVVASGYHMQPVMINYEKYGFIDRIEKPLTYDVLKAVVVKIFNL